MSEPKLVNVSGWVEQAQHDPVRYLERQATEIVLNAIGMTPDLESKIFLKGGALMGVVYQSPRQTADLDFSTSLIAAQGIDITICDLLNRSLPQAAITLGYLNLMLRVQSVEHKPRPQNFSEADFPAIKLRIGYARRGTRQARALESGQCVNVIEVEISFNEPVANAQIVILGPTGVHIRAYALIDLIAEKLRALLQQPIRDRFRRQDIYDIALLLEKFDLDEDECSRLLHVFLSKCRSRQIEPHADSLADPEVIRRAQVDWGSLELEIGKLPSFHEYFARVDDFYRRLPWASVSAIE